MAALLERNHLLFFFSASGISSLVSLHAGKQAFLYDQLHASVLALERSLLPSQSDPIKQVPPLQIDRKCVTLWGIFFFLNASVNYVFHVVFKA